MYYSSSQKEIVAKDPDSYSDFGAPYDDYPIISDPVDLCLPGSYMNPEKSSDIDRNNCPIFMSQRCATNWDDKCSLYINSLDDPMLIKDFLRTTASRKFCQLTPDSTCKVMCQPFNPIAQDSPQVCANVGKDVLKDANDYIDIGWYLPVNMSPDYMGDSCSQSCDVKKGNEIDPSDVVVDACLKYGFCNDILTNVCQNSGGKVSHPGLQRFCDIQTPPQPSKDKMAPLRAMEALPEGGGKYILYFLLAVLLLVIGWTIYKGRKGVREY